MIACLYDIHGNLPALEAVLEDAEARGIRRFLLGGDYTLFGGWPAETVTRLRQLDGAVWIRGNGERWTADPSSAPPDETVQNAIACCREALGPGAVTDLAALPERAAAAGWLAVHGSPLSDVRSFMPEPGEDEAALLAGERPERLVFGHTHLPFLRTSPVGGVLLCNPGSVGMPFDGDPRASYAVVRDDAEVEHVRVAYDHEASAARVDDAFDGAWTTTVAARIRAARFDAG